MVSNRILSYRIVSCHVMLYHVASWSIDRSHVTTTVLRNIVCAHMRTGADTSEMSWCRRSEAKRGKVIAAFDLFADRSLLIAAFDLFAEGLTD